MRCIGSVGLGIVALLALSVTASAKNSQPVAGEAAKDEAVVARVPAPSSEIKAARVSAKRNTIATTAAEPVRDPYAVPLFQRARSLNAPAR